MTALEQLELAVEHAVIEGAVRAIDRRVAALKANTSGDSATNVRRARTAQLLDAVAGDVAALRGPIEPLQGRLALSGPAAVLEHRAAS